MSQNNNRYKRLRAEACFRELLAYVKSGLAAFSHSPLPLLWSAAYWLLILSLPCLMAHMMGLGTFGSKLLAAAFVLASPLFLALYLGLVAWSATPRHAKRITDAFLRIGLTNHAAETPFVVEVNRKRIVVQSNGIPLTEFKDNREKLESALNRRIVRFEEGRDMQQIILHIAPGDARLPTKVPMTKANLPKGDNVLSLGVSLDGPVLVDLAVTPHILAGGSTGSGKTFLVLSLIQQALEKGMEVCILDMKGGVDYPRSWKGDLCNYDDCRAAILSTLSSLTQKLEDRKLSFGYLEQEKGRSCPNIDTYNKLDPAHKLPRILVVCDEVAEITDTTGMDKASKEEVAAIIAKLSTLARLGRAFGISLCLATQRPDANALPGQIKNNLDVHICGRADLVLSQIILDNGDAADLPKDIPGRFICNLDGGTIFQGYYFDDSIE